MLKPNNNDNAFKLDMEVPKVGKIHIELYENTWNATTAFLKSRLLWLLLAVLSSGTIGVHILGRSIPPNPKPPVGEMPAQSK